MSPQQILQQVSEELEKLVHLQDAERLISRNVEKFPEHASELSDLFSEFRNQFEQNNAQTQIDYSKVHYAASRQIPRRIGPYEIGRQLGQGGFGQVFVAQQSEPVERRVAIKLIRQGRTSPQIVARFKHERQAMAEMNHPNIAKMFDGGVTDDGRPYFVMELVNGQPIHKYAAAKELDTIQRLKLFLDVCRGVHHAHQKSVLHRDIKPSNILVAESDGEARVKIIDFGVSKMIRDEPTDETNITKVSQMIGTPRYMSPEQAAMDGAIDTRSDVYSLGVVLYELLTGETPLSQARLESANFDLVRKLICEEEPIKPSDRISSNASHSADISSESSSRRNRVVRGDLDWIVMKALEKEPDRRYASVNAFADDIGRFLNDEPIVARPPSRAYRVRKFIEKNRVLCVAASIVFFTLLSATALSTSYAITATRAAEAERIAKNNEAEKRKQAEAILETLNGILRSPGPLSGGANASIKELLENAIVPIQQKFRDDAETQVVLLNTIGQTLFELGVFDPARRAFEAALESQSAISIAQRLQLRTRLAHSYLAVSKSAAAERLVEQVIVEATAELGPEDETTLEAQFLLVNCFLDSGRQKQAVDLAETTFAIVKEHYQPTDSLFLHFELRLGDTYVGSEAYRKASETLASSIEHHEQLYGKNDYRTRRAKSSMAGVMSTGKSYERIEGKHLIEDFLKLAEQLIDPQHPEILTNKTILGKIHAAQGEYKEAIALQTEVVHQYVRSSGADSLIVLNMRMPLVRYLVANREYERAQQELETISAHPDAAPYMRNVEFQRAQMLIDQKKFQAAKLYLSETLDDTPFDEPWSQMTILMKRQLAMVLFSLKEDQASLELLQQVRSQITEQHGETHPKMPRVYRYIALILERAGRNDEAIENYRKAIALTTELFGEGDPQTVELTNMMGMCFLTGKKIKEHVETVKRAVELTEQHLPKTSLAGHRARFNLAVIYRNQKQYELATPLLRTIVEAHPLMENRDAKHWVFTDAINEMASNCMFRRDREGAAIWYPKYFDCLKKQLQHDRNRYASVLVYVADEMTQHGLYETAEKAMLESLEVRAEIMPGNWLLDNTRNMLAEVRLLRAQEQAGGQRLSSDDTQPIENLLIESFKAMEKKRDTIPDKYRSARLSAAAQRLVKYYKTVNDDEQADDWKQIKANIH